jgi:predicted GIY-YIG superfamily endonuclease
MHKEFDTESNTESNTESKPSFVYLLVASDESATYVGATIDPDRRLRQHNKEIQGGAHATGVKVAKGLTWRRHCYVSGFPDWTAALQFEWRWKQLTRKRGLNGKPFFGKPLGKPLDRRMSALEELLALERPTTKAMAYTEWMGGPPVVHYE